MSHHPRPRLDRSEQEVGAARTLARDGFFAQAVSRAYYAAFYAAEAALLQLGETRTKHSGVVAAFGRLVVVEGGLDRADGRLLRSLFERRNDADYGPRPVGHEQAEVAIEDAERFVDAVRAWLASGEA